MGASLQSIVAATQDQDLRSRIEAAATECGQPPGSITLQVQAVITAEIKRDSEVLSIAAAYEQALEKQPPPPGKDPSAVTDDLIRKAVRAVCGGGDGSH